MEPVDLVDSIGSALPPVLRWLADLLGRRPGFPAKAGLQRHCRFQKMVQEPQYPLQEAHFFGPRA